MSTFSPTYEGSRIADEFPFTIFCKFLEKMASSRGTKKKKEVLNLFIKSWCGKYNQFVSDVPTVSAGLGSFYPVLRLLLPSSDLSRPAYGIGEHVMAKYLVKAFGLSPKGPNASRLIHFNHPRYSSTREGSDLADAVFSALSDRCEASSTLTLSQIHIQLDALCSADTQEVKLSILKKLLRSTTILELKWLTRLISRRELNIGLSAVSVLTCLHPLASSIWNVTQDLCTVCERIAFIDPKKSTTSTTSIPAQTVELFSAFRPMLCSRANNVEDICSGFNKLYSGCADYRLCLELKYDGERVQLHKSGSVYRYWSRSGREWSSSYGCTGDIYSPGTLTKRLHIGSFDDHVVDCILDGEMLGYDTASGHFVTKASGFDVKRPESSRMNELFNSKAETDQIYRRFELSPCFVVFDILFLNGKLLTTEPLFRRKELLLSIFKRGLTCDAVSTALQNGYEHLESPNSPDEHHLCLFPIVSGALYVGGFLFTNPDKCLISQYFDTWIGTGAEGLVAKAITTTYSPGCRQRSGWWKLKPDYVLGLSSDLDCLIVGAYFGSGTGVSSVDAAFNQFLCAVRDDSNEMQSKLMKFNTPHDSLPTFLSFCRVGIGFTREQLNSLNKRLGPFWKTYNRRKVDSEETSWLKVTTERPDVWIPPLHSLILQLHAAEMTASTSYAAGRTLRFPRVVDIRDDKIWCDCATIGEIELLFTSTSGKLTERLLPASDDSVASEAEDTTESHFGISPMSADLLEPHAWSHITRYRQSNRKAPKRKVEVTKPMVGLQFQSAIVDHDRVELETTAFKDCEFCLFLSSDFAGNPELSTTLTTKADIEKGILKSSGRLVQNPGTSTHYIVADRCTAKVKNLIKSTLDQTAKGAEGGYDILTSDWLIESLISDKLAPIRSKHVLAVRSSTRKIIDSCPDKDADSSFCPQTNELEHCPSVSEPCPL